MTPVQDKVALVCQKGEKKPEKGAVVFWNGDGKAGNE